MKTDAVEVDYTVIINWGYWVYNFEKFNKKVHIPRLEQKFSCFYFYKYLITFERNKKFKLIPNINVY